MPMSSCLLAGCVTSCEPSKTPGFQPIDRAFEAPNQRPAALACLIRWRGINRPPVPVLPVMSIGGLVQQGVVAADEIYELTSKPALSLIAQARWRRLAHRYDEDPPWRPASGCISRSFRPRAMR